VLMRRVFTLLALLSLATSSATAQLSDYSQDFESLDRTVFTALSDDGWIGFASGINGAPGFGDFGFGPFPAPNDIAAPFNSVISESTGGDPPAGNQGLLILSDYNSDLHSNPADPRDLVISIFQEQIISAGDIGKSVNFSFLADGNVNPPSGDATAEAFLLTLDPNNGFIATNNLAFDTTNVADGSNIAGSLSLDITDPLLVGQILQFGFRNTASDFEGSAVDYDNVVFSVIPEPTAAAMVALAGVAGLVRRRR
ncbi:MAG: PEP-CTERM sorting domain-containing protein, partial [Planctomycetota bacterium]